VDQPLIFKIVPAALWNASVRTGSFAGAKVDIRDGFIHFSTALQVRETADRHFKGVEDLLLVAIDAGALELRWEPSRGGDLFPHLYGALPLSAVRWVRELPLDASGGHRFPDLD
jgi:uncharacterized protein (DUF952 family)